jgi:hypothetical protein
MREEICCAIVIKNKKWLTPVIPATWEVAIRRLTIQGQPRQKVLKIPLQSITQAWWSACHPSYAGNINRRSWSKPART